VVALAAVLAAGIAAAAIGVAPRSASVTSAPPVAVTQFDMTGFLTAIWSDRRYLDMALINVKEIVVAKAA
jgi:hypothetical protein